MKTTSNLAKVVDLTKKIQLLAKKNDNKIEINSLSKAADIAAYLLNYNNWSDFLKSNHEAKILNKYKKHIQKIEQLEENTSPKVWKVDLDIVDAWLKEITVAKRVRASDERQDLPSLPKDISGYSNKFIVGSFTNDLKSPQPVSVDNENLIVFGSDDLNNKNLFDEYANFCFKNHNNVFYASSLKEISFENEKDINLWGKDIRINILPQLLQTEAFSSFLGIDLYENPKHQQLATNWLMMISKMHESTFIGYNPKNLIKLCDIQHIIALTKTPLRIWAQEFLDSLSQEYDLEINPNSWSQSSHKYLEMEKDFYIFKLILIELEEEYDNQIFSISPTHSIEDIIYKKIPIQFYWTSILSLEAVVLAIHETGKQIDKKIFQKKFNPTYLSHQILISDGMSSLRPSIISHVKEFPKSISWKFSLKMFNECWSICMDNVQQFIFMKNENIPFNQLTEDLMMKIVFKTKLLRDNIAFNNFLPLNTLDDKSAYLWKYDNDLNNIPNSIFEMKKIILNY